MVVAVDNLHFLLVWLVTSLCYFPLSHLTIGLLRGHNGKESACQSRRCQRRRFDPGSGRSPEEGDGNPLQYFWLKNSTDRGTWQLQSMELQTIRHNLATEPTFKNNTEFSLKIFK